jgi:hypothetical protein
MPSDLGCNDGIPISDGAEAEPDIGSCSGSRAARPIPAIDAEPTDAAVWLIPLA